MRTVFCSIKNFTETEFSYGTCYSTKIYGVFQTKLNASVISKEWGLKMDSMGSMDLLFTFVVPKGQGITGGPVANNKHY